MNKGDGGGRRMLGVGKSSNELMSFKQLASASMGSAFIFEKSMLLAELRMRLRLLLLLLGVFGVSGATALDSS